VITLDTIQKYNIRSKLRARLFDETQEDDTKNLLDIKYIRDIRETRKVPSPVRTSQFVDLSLAETSYSPIDFPRIHVVFGNETGSRLTVDTNTRLRDFTFTVAVYLNSYLGIDVETGLPLETKYLTEDKNMLLSRLEDLAAWVDYKLVTNHFGDREGITVFDLDATDYAIQTESDGGDSGSSTYGVVTLTYRINYYLRYS